MLGPLVYWKYDEQEGYGILLPEMPLLRRDRKITAAVLLLEIGIGHTFSFSDSHPECEAHFHQVKKKFPNVTRGRYGYWVHHTRPVGLREMAKLYMERQLTRQQVLYLKTKLEPVGGL